MSAMIDGRARITGTRITVYDVLTYAEAGWHPSSIAGTLGVSTAQVKAVLDYVAQNREEVMKTYRAILARIERGNPPELEAKLQQSVERFRAKLRESEQRNGV
ncbi:MAG: DUF433 domain-containing protein [Planctomycetota bacterium]